MLSTIVFILAAVLVLHHPQTANSDGSSCVNPRGDSGVCQKLTTCEPLRQLLLQYGDRVAKFVRQSLCTNDVKELHVCCPTSINIKNKRNNTTNNNNTNNSNNINPVTLPTATSSYGPLLPSVWGTTDAKYTRVVGGVPTKLGPGSSCVNPRGDSGVCQKLTTCEPLRQLLLQYGDRVATFVRQSLCTNGVKDPHVCCPTSINIKNKRNNTTNNNNTSNNNINNSNNINPVTLATATSSYGPLLPPVCGTTDAKYTRVVGGVPAKLGHWPWITALGYRGRVDPNKPRWLCGGSLISARHVLTAAHCIYKRDDLFVVRIGDLDLEDNNDGATPIDAYIERRSIHPQYAPNLYANDIAVLRLQLDIQFTPLIRPLCLPVTDSIRQRNLVGTFPFLVGWGTIYYNGPSRPQLQQIQVPIVPQEQCKVAYNNYSTIAIIDDRVFCAGYAQGGRDACQGDSGGPLMFPIGKSFYAIGIVSYGFGCARPGFPGVYTNTTTFLDFIIPLLN